MAKPWSGDETRYTVCIPVGTHGVDEELTDADAQQVGATHRLVGEVLLL